MTTMTGPLPKPCLPRQIRNFAVTALQRLESATSGEETGQQALLDIASHHEHPAPSGLASAVIGLPIVIR